MASNQTVQEKKTLFNFTFFTCDLFLTRNSYPHFLGRDPVDRN